MYKFSFMSRLKFFPLSREDSKTVLKTQLLKDRAGERYILPEYNTRVSEVAQQSYSSFTVRPLKIGHSQSKTPTTQDSRGAMVWQVSWQERT